MNHLFPIPAKPTFGTVKPLLYSSDYLNLKKTREIRRESLINKYKNYGSYENHYLSHQYSYRNKFDRYNLIYNLYSQENLNHVATVGTGINTETPPSIATKINPTLKPFYQFYNIDYKGELFGNSQCGELNYVNYVEPQLSKCLEKK